MKSKRSLIALSILGIVVLGVCICVPIAESFAVNTGSDAGFLAKISTAFTNPPKGSVLDRVAGIIKPSKQPGSGTAANTYVAGNMGDQGKGTQAALLELSKSNLSQKASVAQPSNPASSGADTRYGSPIASNGYVPGHSGSMQGASGSDSFGAGGYGRHSGAGSASGMAGGGAAAGSGSAAASNKESGKAVQPGNSAYSTSAPTAANSNPSQSQTAGSGSDLLSGLNGNQSNPYASSPSQNASNPQYVYSYLPDPKSNAGTMQDATMKPYGETFGNQAGGSSDLHSGSTNDGSRGGDPQSDQGGQGDTQGGSGYDILVGTQNKSGGPDALQSLSTNQGSGGTDDGKPGPNFAAVRPVQTPEPTTFLLIGSGMVGLYFLNRRRRG